MLLLQNSLSASVTRKKGNRTISHVLVSSTPRKFPLSHILVDHIEEIFSCFALNPANTWPSLLCSGWKHRVPYDELHSDVSNTLCAGIDHDLHLYVDHPDSRLTSCGLRNALASLSSRGQIQGLTLGGIVRSSSVRKAHDFNASSLPGLMRRSRTSSTSPMAQASRADKKVSLSKRRSISSTLNDFFPARSR